MSHKLFGPVFFRCLSELSRNDNPWPGSKLAEEPNPKFGHRQIAYEYNGAVRVYVYSGKEYLTEEGGPYFGVMFSLKDDRMKEVFDRYRDDIGREMGETIRPWRIMPKSGRWEMQFNLRKAADEEGWAENAGSAYDLIQRAYGLWDRILNPAIAAELHG